MIYAQPGQPGSLITFKKRYENFIGGEWVPPIDGEYFENISPVTGLGQSHQQNESCMLLQVTHSHGVWL